MIQHVYESARRARRVDKVVVATDDPRILDCVVSFGGEAVMTSTDHTSGTDRIAEAVELLSSGDRTNSFSTIVNVQGDEPTIPPDLLDQLVATVLDSSVDCATAVTPITTSRDLFDTNIVKVACRADGTPLYFSRSPIPCHRDVPPEDWVSTGSFYRHIGVYALRPGALADFVASPPSVNEIAEQLEQLRMLEIGVPMICVHTAYAGHSVDTPEDVMRVEALMAGAE